MGLDRSQSVFYFLPQESHSQAGSSIVGAKIQRCLRDREQKHLLCRISRLNITRPRHRAFGGAERELWCWGGSGGGSLEEQGGHGSSSIKQKFTGTTIRGSQVYKKAKKGIVVVQTTVF